MAEINPTQTYGRAGERNSWQKMGISAAGSIRVRIIFIAMLAIVSVSVTQIIIFGSMSRQQFKDMVICYMEDLADSYQKTMNIRVADLAEEGRQPDVEFWEEMVGGLDIMGMEGSYAYIVDRNGTMCYHPTADRIGSRVENEAVNAALVELKQGIIPQKAVSIKYVYRGENKYAAYSVTEDGSYIFVITADETTALKSSNENMKSSDEIVIASIFWGCITMLICMVIVFFICDIIVKPLKKIAELAMTFAELDFREDQDQKKLSVKKDEIGAISRAVDTLRGHLCRVIGRIESHSATVMETSHMLSEDADSIFGTVKQVERAVQEMAKGSTSQAGETQQAMESIVLMGSMIEENSMEMEELHKTAEGMYSSSEVAASALSTMDTVNRKAQQAIDLIYEQTNTTNESAMKIKEAATLITSIANQTNLLSLNASIEAARAGEQGRGFAVVAGQIQKLAEESNESAKQIEGIIAHLIQDSEKAVQTMDEVKVVMENQNENVELTREQFSEMHSGVKKTIEGIRSIAEKMEQIDSTRSGVVDIVQNLTALAEENAAGTEEVSASVTEVGEHMSRIAGKSGELRQIADELQSEIEVFTI
ncbi:MAG: HAMP domain-containing protein [Lachnospiraceae bacterium]|jgi:methyl-accepting chemotaxis protein|nr:HAMP domain-containing protein [Lachnospiraceae bacterium]